MSALPPLPEGAKLDSGLPPLPAGASVDTPAVLPPLPGGAKLDNPTWQTDVQKVKLPSGLETVIRPDGYIWLDDTKIAPGEQKKFKTPGWHTPDLWGGWKKGPDAPKAYSAAGDPKVMGDFQIATKLLGMTPEEYLAMSTAPTYKPGMMKAQLNMEAPNANPTLRALAAPFHSLVGGAEQGAQNVVTLATKPASWLGNPGMELWSKAQSKLMGIIQNQRQGRPALEGGLDPLHMAGQFAIGRGPNVGGAAPGAALNATNRAVALEQAAATAGREAPSLAMKAKDIYLGALPEAIKTAGVTAATTDGSIPNRAMAGMTAGVAAPVIETGVGTVVAPGIQRIMNFGKALFDKNPKRLPGAAGKIEDLANLWNVDTNASNLVTNPASQVRTLGEHATAAPVGSLGAENVAQQVQATRAVKNFQNQLKTRMMKAGYDNMEALVAARNAGEKQAVVLYNLANEAGNDLPKVIAANGNINRWAAQQKVSRLAEEAIASDTGALAGAAEMEPALTTVDRLLKQHGPETVGEANVNKPLVDYLKRVKKDLTTKNVKVTAQPNGSGDSAASVEAINRVAQEQALDRPRVVVDLRTGQITPVAATVDAVDQLAAPNTALVQKGIGKDDGWVVLNHNSKAPQTAVDAAMARVQGSLAAWEKANPTTRPIVDNGSDFQATYTGLANYRKGIQQKRQAMGTPGSELTGNDATAALKELQTGIDQSLEATSALSPGTAAKDRLMRETHLAEVVPFKKRSLINLLSTDTPDVVANRMASMTEDQLREIVPQLGEKGKAAARLHMVNKAVDQSMNRSNPNPNYQFQPIEFAKKMTDPKFAEALGVTVPKGGEGRWELNGLVELMGHLQTAGKTSSAEGAYTLSRRVVSTPAAAMKWLLTTKPGKQFLLQASDLKAGSPQFAALVDRVNKLMPAEIGKSSAPSDEEN